MIFEKLLTNHLFIEKNSKTTLQNLFLKNLFKSELHVEEDKRDMAHKKITGIAEKIGFHKKILDYDLSLNAADLLNKKDSS